MAKSTNDKKGQKSDGGTGVGDLSAVFAQLNTASTNVVDLIGNLDKVATAAMQIGIRKRFAIKAAKRFVGDYMDMVSTIVNNIATFVPEDKTLSEVLGYQETMNEEIKEHTQIDGTEKDTKKTSTDGKYPLLDFMGGFATMINNMIEPMEKIMTNPVFIIAGSRFGGFMRKAFQGFASMLGLLLDTIFESISGIDTSNMGAAMALLVGDPEKVEKISKKTDNSTSKEGQTNTDITDEVKEVTTGKKMGILELITGLLGIFDTISNTISLNPVKTIIMALRISKFSEYVQNVVTGLLGILSPDELKDPEGTAEKYKKFGEIFQSIGSIIDAVAMIEIPSLKDIILMSIRLRLFTRHIVGNLHNIKGNGLLDKLAELITIGPGAILTGNDIPEKIDALTETITKFANICASIAALPMMRLRVGKTNIKLLIWYAESGIPQLVESISNAMEKIDIAVLTNTEAKFKQLQEFLTGFKSIMASVCIIGLLAIPFILSIFFAVAAVWALVLFMKMTQKAFELIAKFAPQTAANAMIILICVGVVAAVMIIITLSLVVIAKLFQIIIDNIVTLLIGLGILMLVLVAFMLLSWGVGYIAPFILLGAITTMIVVVAMTITIGGLMLVALMLIAMTFIAEWMEPNKILEAVDTVLGTALKVLEKIITTDFGMRDKADSNTGIVGGILRLFLGGQAATIIDLMEKIIILTLTIMVVIVMIILVVVLQGLTALVTGETEGPDGVKHKKFDPDAILEAVKTVLKTAHDVIDVILNSGDDSDFGKQSSTDDGIFGFILGLVGGGQLIAIFDLVTKIIILGLTILVVGILYVMVNLLVDLYEKLKSEETQKALTELPEKVRNLMGSISEVISSIVNSGVKFGNDEESSKLGSWVKSILPDSIVEIAEALATLGKMGMILAMLGMVNTIAKQADETATILGKYSDGPKNLAPNVENLMSTIRVVAAKLNTLDDDNDLKDLLEKSKSYSQVIKDTDTLINKINGLNLDKMKSLAEMFGNAAAFSKSIEGNFDKLADVLSEKIAPLITELKDAITDADTHAAERAQQKAENPAPAPTPAAGSAEKAQTEQAGAIAAAANGKSKGRDANAMTQSIIDALAARHIGRD